MTKEELVKRRAEMVNLKTQMLANAQLCEGAVQDCDYWLQKLAADETMAKAAAETAKGEANG